MSIVKLRRAKKCIMLFVLCTYVLVVNTHLIQVKKKHHLCLHTGLKIRCNSRYCICTAQISSMQVKSSNNLGIIFFICLNKLLAPFAFHRISNRNFLTLCNFTDFFYENFAYCLVMRVIAVDLVLHSFCKT